MPAPQAAAVTRVEQAVIFTIRAIVVGELTGHDGRRRRPWPGWSGRNSRTASTVCARVSTPSEKTQAGGQPSR